ncbi:MAG: DUF1802 family protein [Plectolyngbya sp. WJT66-NPBG17]|jgi:hypothetical protein|nr:DUF1802 family protein [Plectolyngbya sp. WJT66-NPBG17]MBW4526016.1 DUF1802 family protein [Phormidium tanganyikae FI6-MK23]
MVLIDRALCLPAVDIAALLYGQSIVAISNVFVQTGWSFALYPCVDTTRTYRLKPQSSCSNTLRGWAKCEHCIVVEDANQIESLSHLTIWTKDALKDHLEQKQRLILTFLRVYSLPEAIEISTEIAPDKLGKFTSLSPTDVSNILPVLSDRIFAQRKHQLENLEPPEHPELEALHSAIAQLTPTHPSASHLEQDLKCFLGWTETAIVDRADSDLNWIPTIATIGNSSDGDTFEKVVRKGFIKLGFTNSRNDIKVSLDPNATGGAGGIDFYCEAPYAIVGECKASKTESVPDSTPAQLIKLGHKHLPDKEYDQAIKVIMAAGKLNHHAKQTAIGNKMNVIRPETLERLVDLKAKHPGAINLWELKPCLEQPPFGEDADQKVNQYVDRCWQQIKVRAQIVQLLHKKAPQALELGFILGVYDASSPSQPLDREELQKILIELSSPMAGFVGCRKENDGSDRFYFLRPLNLES